MKRLFLMTGISALLLSACGSGWTPLFEGDSFGLWQSVYGEDFPEVGWSMENGVVTSNPCGVRGGDIMTRKAYGNFILSLEFKLDPLSNSGIKYFIPVSLKNPTSAANTRSSMTRISASRSSPWKQTG